TVPRKSTFTCGSCGQRNDLLSSIRDFGHTGPSSPYCLQGFCPQCKQEGRPYDGRFFKAPDLLDIQRIQSAESEWDLRRDSDLSAFWPKDGLPFTFMTHQNNGGLPNWGYTNFFNISETRTC